MKLKEVLADTAIKLSGSGIEGAARDARILTANALGTPISELSVKINEQVPEKIIADLERNENLNNTINQEINLKKKQIQRY